MNQSAPIPVLLLTRQLSLGGTERQVANLAKSLDPKKFSVRVCCFHAGGIRQAEIEAAGVPVWILPVQAFWSPNTLAHAWSLFRYLVGERIALVHSFSPATTIFSTPIARLARVPAVLSSSRAERSLMRPRDSHLVRITDHWVDAIVTNCEHLRQELLLEKTAAKVIHVCGNGIDLDEFNSTSQSRPPWVGTLSVLRPEKNLGILVEAFGRIHGLYPNARLQIVGSGPLSEALARQAALCGLGDASELIGASPQPAEYFRKFRIFVLPSQSEGLSNSLLEAMACGCAVVASRVGGSKEIIRHGENGMLFDLGDADQLASTLKLLLGEEDLCRRLGEAAARTIRQQFSLSASAKRLEEIYSNHLATSPRNLS